MAEKKKTTLKTKLLIGAAAAVLLAGGAFVMKQRSAAAAAKARQAAVKTGTAEYGDITRKISSTGMIEPKDTYSVMALVTGTVIEANFEEGDEVEEGTVLYRIDAASMESELSSAENNLSRAEKGLARAQQNYSEAAAKYGGGVYKATQAGYVTKVYLNDGQKVGNGTSLVDLTDETVMEVQIPFLSGEIPYINTGSEALLTLSDTLEQVTGQVIAVGAQEVVLDGGRLVHYVTIRVDNPGGLSTETAVSCRIGEFDCVEEGTLKAVMTTTMAADLDSGVNCVQVLVHVGDRLEIGTPVFSIASNSVRDILDSFSDKVDTQQASVDTAQQKLDTTTENRDKYTITAPITGRVIRKNIKVGDKIGSNSGQNSSTVMATIYDMSAYVFEMSIDETDISEIEIGQRVEVTADAFKDETFSGTVTNISLESSTSNGVSSYPVRVTMDSTDMLLPGMNVDAEIIIESAEDTLLIPADALMRGNRVYVKDDSVKEAEGAVPAGFRAIEVETGLINEDKVEIFSDELDEGDEVMRQQSSAGNSNWNRGMNGGMPGMSGMPGISGGMSGQGNRGGYSGRSGGSQSGRSR